MCWRDACPKTLHKRISTSTFLRLGKLSRIYCRDSGTSSLFTVESSRSVVIVQPTRKAVMIDPIAGRLNLHERIVQAPFLHGINRPMGLKRITLLREIQCQKNGRADVRHLPVESENHLYNRLVILQYLHLREMTISEMVDLLYQLLGSKQDKLR